MRRHLVRQLMDTCKPPYTTSLRPICIPVSACACACLCALPMCLFVRVWVCESACIRLYVCLRVRMSVRLCMCVSVSEYVYMSVCCSYCPCKISKSELEPPVQCI